MGMELVTGGNLMNHLLNQPQAFTESLVRPMMYHIACAMAHAHEAGVMHRDMKPENVLIASNWMPKICDFGFARTVGIQDMCMSLAGSPGYVAPEVSMQIPYNFPADVYSCGLIFHDFFSHQHVCEWWLSKFTQPVRDALRKKWPSGTSPSKKSTRLNQLEKSMLCQVPGERITMFKVCQELATLAKEDPMPCKLWHERTKMPSGPSEQKWGVTPENAADVAGRFGIAVGCPVHVNCAGAWKNGVVEHISTTACPGAAQIRVDGNVVLVCPWQFSQLLRPDASNSHTPTLPADPMRTVLNPVPILPPTAKASGKGKDVVGGGANHVKGDGKSKGKGCNINYSEKDQALEHGRSGGYDKGAGKGKTTRQEVSEVKESRCSGFSMPFGFRLGKQEARAKTNS